MDIIVTTNVLRNDGGRHADGASKWRNTGVREYIISNVEVEQDAIAFVLAYVRNDIVEREFPTRYEEWDRGLNFTPSERHQLRYGDIWNPAIRLDYSDKSILADKERT